jgi:hypothetical protein
MLLELLLLTSPAADCESLRSPFDHLETSLGAHN